MPRLVHDAVQVDAFTKRIHLHAKRFEGQPIYWQNFVNQHVVEHASHVTATQIIDEQLAVWHARLHGNHVQFENHDTMWQWILTYA